MIQLRLTMFEDDKLPRHYEIQISDEDLALTSIASGNLGAFNSPEIRALSNRRGQNKLIRRAAENLGAQMADYRDDRDGWNGERRAEIIAKVGREQP